MKLQSRVLKEITNSNLKRHIRFLKKNSNEQIVLKDIPKDIVQGRFKINF